MRRALTPSRWGEGTGRARTEKASPGWRGGRLVVAPCSPRASGRLQVAAVIPGDDAVWLHLNVRHARARLAGQGVLRHAA